MTPHFDQPVPRDGYLWWYLDALSDDGRHGLTLIAFVGSVFSPYYARARRQAPTDPENHCAVNIAVYGPGGRWAMTERGRHDLQRTRDRYALGPSVLQWTGAALDIQVDEIAFPLLRRLRGHIRLHPASLNTRSFALDGSGRHRWQPIAPVSRIEVDLGCPKLRWSGHAYLDSNTGDEPLEQAFSSWDWSRAVLDDGRSVVLYDARRRDGGSTHLALQFDARGQVDTVEAPGRVALPSTGWRLARETRADHPGQVSVMRTLEDTPFYARSLLSTSLAGRSAVAVHESLSLDRFAATTVQWMLPFRMPRRARR
jgi:carotenoid 1,2-hydratase